jgi:hypothetical protein
MADQPDTGRRRFLTGAPALGLAALAAPADAAAEVEEASEAPEDPRQPVYRETEHVRAYYRAARN